MDNTGLEYGIALNVFLKQSQSDSIIKLFLITVWVSGRVPTGNRWHEEIL